MGLLKGFAQRVLATERRVVPGAVKRFVAARSPLEYFYEEPIGQVYIADGTYDTFLCFNNFFTVLNPELPTAAELRVDLYDAGGHPLARHVSTVPPDGSMALSARELLEAAGAASDHGLAACSLRPLASGREASRLYKQMGRISSHFFTYYLHAQSQAMAIIHPQSAINQPGANGRGDWRSGQSIVTDGLEGVSLWQANHSAREAAVRYTLCDVADDRPVASQTARVAPRGVAAVHFEAVDPAEPAPLLYVRADRLPTPNGKPLLMRRYGRGRFSMNHS